LVSQGTWGNFFKGKTVLRRSSDRSGAGNESVALQCPPERQVGPAFMSIEANRNNEEEANYPNPSKSGAR
jgi:hypothetical protein